MIPYRIFSGKNIHHVGISRHDFCFFNKVEYRGAEDVTYPRLDIIAINEDIRSFLFAGFNDQHLESLIAKSFLPRKGRYHLRRPEPEPGLL